MLIEDLHESDPFFLDQVHQILYGDHWDPHLVLGLHPYFQGKKSLRVFRPDATEIYVHVNGDVHVPRKIHQGGFFDLIVEEEVTPSDYQVYHSNGLLAHDPYAFPPIWGELDTHLFARGVHYEIFERMGAHERELMGVKGVCFTVWAPSASRVSLVGDFNFWDGRVNPMRCMGSSGVWELFVPGLTVGERYKFEIKTQSGDVVVKADPYAFSSEIRPLNASCVGKVNDFDWHDREWLEKRDPHNGPMNIYEVHLGTWEQKEGEFLNYRDLAVKLATYCREMGYTHVELLPIMEHPFDESWGYQVTGYYGVTSRYGTIQDFQWMVDYLHNHHIGVILDWVPAHFPTDGFSLAQFDGTALYEHADPRQGFHPHWQTLIFNYGRHEVSNFLIGSALFWLEKMHIDGLRVDAVASMLYLDYGRSDGEWIPNRYGGKENLEAIEFLKHLNAIVHTKFPNVVMIAEESTSFPGVTKEVQWGGLGFDYKWNMGWMNDTLRYFNQDPIFRSHHHRDLTFGLLYAFSEQFILPFSHDEVVHGKGSLLSKMPGDYWQKFANLRLLLAYQICQPGKKLLFMGGELGMWDEWNVKHELQWNLLEFPIHNALHTFVKELNHLYIDHPALWREDHDFSGFEWVEFNDHGNSIISYKRKGKEGEELFCLHNFTPNYHHEYFVPLNEVTMVKEIFNSDEKRYGGSGKVNLPLSLTDKGCQLAVPPLASVVYQIKF